MPAFWLIVMEACVWLIDYWMYETHAHSWSDAAQRLGAGSLSCDNSGASAHLAATGP